MRRVKSERIRIAWSPRVDPRFRHKEGMPGSLLVVGICHNHKTRTNPFDSVSILATAKGRRQLLYHQEATGFHSSSIV